ncbi:sphingolipid c9-methyltransferase [Paraphaeosphaeria sporulosa]
MTAEAPDPRTFTSWEDAFQYPIPVVRKLEQQLRSNADENREKLRSLVGASYRSLLDTAETIIDMEVRMEHVEGTLARVGHNCNSTTLDRITSSAVRLDAHIRSRDQERYTFASQLAVLRSSPVVMTRLMHSAGSYLSIAKVLVISRLLHKALSQSADKPPLVDQLWERLLSARRRLIKRIEKRMGTSEGDYADLVESMCAYALITSSTPTDVLHHFHKIRLENSVKLLQHGSDELAKHGTSALRLCIQTCLDTQAIFPRRLAESLAKLKAHPLIQDHDVRALHELNLDIHDRWIGEEARNYTPWPRHDELQRADAERILHQWSRQAISAFLKGTKDALENETRLKEVSSLRQDLIETWIMSGPRMAGVKSANVLDDLRDMMNNHLEDIVRLRSQTLKTVVVELSNVLNSPTLTQSSGLSLWGTYPKSADISNGAQAFKSTLVNIHQGRDNSVVGIVSAFDAWADSILEVKSIVKSMKEARWDDTFADDVDDSDDDDLGDSKQTLLSDDDPRLLEEATQEALAHALQNLGKSFGQIITQVTECDDGIDVLKICFVLRVTREIGERIPKLKLQDRATLLATPFTPALLKPLHKALASHVAHPSMDAYAKALATGLKSKTDSHILWEGNPALPAQPSPSAVRYLQSMTKAMAAYGNDLWAPLAVEEIKSSAIHSVLAPLKANLDAIKQLAAAPAEDQKNEKINGDSAGAGKQKMDTDAEEQVNGKKVVATAAAAELRDGKLKQAVFDMLYIQRFIGNPHHTPDAIDEMVNDVDRAALDENSRVRLRKSAADYAKKTYLLFALLA